jgi:chromosome segregation protein
MAVIFPNFMAGSVAPDYGAKDTIGIHGLVSLPKTARLIQSVGTRMYLERLDIQGFKSFATKVTLEFRRGITAIVGPNGSGKSNTADAIRWALGEQSIKTLRGKKSDDVIFAGSDKKTRLSAAEVTLTLNNEDRRAPIDYSEMALTRRINRAGEGEYFINKSQARLHDIQLMLAKANFGQRSYSVIGQGMVDSFLVVSPQERKELFEDATGVRQFQIKRDQAVTKLDHTQENLLQAEAIVMEIEPRMRSLTRQVKRLERREEVERELRAKQQAAFSRQLRTLALERKHHQEEFEKTDAVRIKLEGELNGIQGELAAIEREHTTSEVFQRLQTDYTKLLNQKNALVEEQATLQGRAHAEALASGDVDVVFLEKRLAELKRKITEAESEYDLAGKEFSREQNARSAKREQLDQLSVEFSRLDAALEKARAAFSEEGLVKPEELKTALVELMAEADSFIDALQKLENMEQLTKLRREALRFQESMVAVRTRLDRAQIHDPAELIALQGELSAFTKKREALAHEVAEAETRTRLAEERQRTASTALETLRSELADVERTLTSVKHQASSPEKAAADMAKRRGEIEAEMAVLDRDLAKVREEISSFHQTEQKKKDRLFSLQKTFQEIQHKVNIQTQQVNDIRVTLAKLDTHREDLVRELTTELPEEVRAATLAEAENLKGQTGSVTTEEQEEVLHLKHQLELIGGIEEGTTAEYEQTKERFDFLTTQIADLSKAKADLEQVIAELDETIKTRFDASFELINEQFSKFFRTLFNGGRAKLTLIKQDVAEQIPDSDDEDEDDDDEDEEETAPKQTAPTKVRRIVAGIDIQATPPGKKLSSIAMLSGGERALTSIALICAIIANNPAPFVVLDEVDAALDEANSLRFAAILEKLSEKTQFITITHNRATMEKANILYGVTMGDDGISRLLSIKMEDVEDVIQKHGNR